MLYDRNDVYSLRRFVHADAIGQDTADALVDFMVTRVADEQGRCLECDSLGL